MDVPNPCGDNQINGPVAWLVSKANIYQQNLCMTRMKNIIDRESSLTMWKLLSVLI